LDCDLSVALRSIQQLLKGEAEYWFKSDHCKVAEKKKIGTYDIAIELLIGFIQEKNLNAFLLVFAKYGITIVGIRGCFYNSGPQVKAKRNRARSSAGRFSRLSRRK